MNRADDERWMTRCLELARMGEGRTAPNPLVGAVVLDARGRVAGEGYHRAAGTDHGEIVALEDAGWPVEDGTLYVNLEPCNHHGRTGPCSEAIIRSRVSRVVFGARDPIAGHAGGAAALRDAGIEVRAGVLGRQCRELNRGFFSVAERGRPWTVLKIAVSADGKVARAAGESQWVTGEAARADGHELRDRLDAIVVGVGTVLADDPRLTARARALSWRPPRDPVRVVVDSALRTPTTAKLLEGEGAIIAATATSKQSRRRALSKVGADIVIAGKGKRVGLSSLWRELAGRGLTTVLVEGGPVLSRGLLTRQLVDEIVLYRSRETIGAGGKPWQRGVTNVVAELRRRGFSFSQKVTELGDDVRLLGHRKR